MSASKKSSRRWARASGVFLLSVAAFCAAAAGQVYRWKDANGQWHYGERAPDGVAAETVTIRPGPAPESTPPPPPEYGPDGLPLDPALAATPAPVLPAPRTVREVQRGCSTIVNACAVPNGPDRATCLSTVRQCAADPTMERQDCCPAACSLRYAELRSQGLPDGLAFTRAIYGAPSCVPGGDDAIAQPTPPP